jgi:hypothetical protein
MKKALISQGFFVDICIVALWGKNDGVAPDQPPASHSPPDCGIQMGSRPVVEYLYQKETPS